jgi:tetratricopeptide (TPR) repeat protein
MLRQNFWKAALLLLVILPGCSRTKDTWLSRNWHMLSSKYNPLFNGNEALDKGVNTVHNSHRDDYLQLLPVYIWPDEAQAQGIEKDMERAEEKGVKTIKEHSMVFGREQRNKYIDDSYLLIGKSRFYRRYWFPALEAFNYIIVEFPKDDLIHEARLWAARTYTQTGNFAGAEEQLLKIYKSPKVDKKLQKEIVASMAEKEIAMKNYPRAIELLEEAKGMRIGKKRKVRYTYIQAQLQEKLGKKFEASELYRKVVKMKPEYEFYFAAQMARVRNFDPYLQKSAPVYAELRKMLRNDKNFDNRDQIYYAMADIAIKEDLIPEAFDYLANSIATNTTNKTQLGISHLKKGELHFEFREYLKAAAHYDSASQSLPKEHPRYDEVMKKKESLAELVEHIKTIEVEDSLQAMANMSEKERMKKIEKHIRYLEKEKEAREREAEGGGSNFGPAQGGGGFAMGGGRSGKWYFYDDNQRNTGFSEFNNRWGTRKLEDNWRRKNKTSVSDFTAGGEGGEGEGEGAERDSTQDPFHPAYYLIRIPTDPDSLQASHNRIVKAHQGAGSVYRDVLEDLPEAVKMFEQLMKRYPGADFEARTLYTLCLMTRETRQAEKSENYCGKLQSDYGHTVFAQVLDGTIDPEMDAGHDAEAEQFYRGAYQKFEDGKYKESKQMVVEGLEKYAETDLVPRLEFLLALCIGSEGSLGKFTEQLSLLASKYEGSALGIEAQSILDYLGGNSQLTALSAEVEKLFNSERNEPFQYVLVLPRTGTDFNRIRNSISDFNMNEYPNDRLTSKNILLGEENQLIIISGFKRAAPALEYYEKIKTKPEIAQYLPQGNYKHFVISQSNFKIMYQKQAVDDYMQFFKVKFASQ